jgi:hypothetical protein
MFEDFVPLNPVGFFALGCDCHFQEFDPKKDLTKAFLLPNMSDLCGEESFADLAMAWGYEGITVQVDIHQPFAHPVYPAVTTGDSVELFFDTRDVKSSGFNTRFCHHFFFLPTAVEGTQAGELTHFRTEDTHELCDAKRLLVINTSKKNSARLKIFLPHQCLHGYDPEQFDRLGFSYRINRLQGEPQHFSAVSQNYQIEQQPSLWSSVRLRHENRPL